VRYKPKQPFISYEIEIKISLILLIAFLLSLNFLSAYSLQKVRQAQKSGFLTKLDLSIDLIENQVELDNFRLPEATFLNDICVLSGADKIELTDNLGNKLTGVGVAAGKNSGWLADKATVRESIIYNKQNQCTYVVRVSGINREEAGLKQMAFWDTIFRSLGLIASLVVALLFFRSVMDPYRKIKKEASDLNISVENHGKNDGVEYAVRLFQAVIQQLKEKEAILQAMYDNSEKRADSLARYNEYILGSISSGAIICDNQGIITRLNRSATTITGFGESFAQGKHFNDVFGKKHKISRILGDALNGRTYSRQEFEIKREDGQILWIGLSSSLITDDKAQNIGAAVLLTDLTRIKKLQEMADYREKMAALGEMSSGLAHELRNSVAAIVGFGKLLKKMALPDEKAINIVDTVISESMATEEMLSRFLNFARPLRLNAISCDIESLLDECMRQSEDLKQGKEIEFVIEKRGDIPMIVGDPLLLKNAFSNLIINAYQAIPDSGRLELAIEYYAQEKRLQISIGDSGVGITADDLPKIFNPFFTTKEKGTGLGLALVKKIITAHNGTIEVSSKLAEGARFIISLPMDTPAKNDELIGLSQKISENAYSVDHP
jgi:PAS domain S-box-containing protein